MDSFEGFEVFRKRGWKSVINLVAAGGKGKLHQATITITKKITYEAHKVSPPVIDPLNEGNVCTLE